jgi:hypothetical protein
MKLPAFVFYPGDWMKDPALRSVTLTARGLWIDMLCLMFESPRRGYLQLANGSRPTPEQLARMVGCSAEDVTRALQELLAAGVYSDTAHGMLSRRMLRDEEQRAKTRERVRKFRNGGVTPPSRPPEDETENDSSGSGSFPLPENPKANAPKPRAPEDLTPPPGGWPQAEPVGMGTDGRTPGFRRFLEAYPPAGRQPSLARQWVALGLEPIADQVLQGLALWKACEQWNTGYGMSMRRFLEDRKWNDAPPPPKGDGKPKAPDFAAIVAAQRGGKK